MLDFQSPCSIGQDEYEMVYWFKITTQSQKLSQKSGFYWPYLNLP